MRTWFCSEKLMQPFCIPSGLQRRPSKDGCRDLSGSSGISWVGDRRGEMGAFGCSGEPAGLLGETKFCGNDWRGRSDWDILENKSQVEKRGNCQHYPMVLLKIRRPRLNFFQDWIVADTLGMRDLVCLLTLADWQLSIFSLISAGPKQDGRVESFFSWSQASPSAFGQLGS